MKRISKYTLGILSLILGGLALTQGVNAALSYQDSVTLSFDWGASLSMTVSETDLLVDSLSPGTSGSSNAITIAVNTNDGNGYVLSATVGSSANTTTSLTNTAGNTFTMLGTSDSVTLASMAADSTTVGKWGYSLNGSSTYSGLPIYTGTAKVLYSGKNASNTFAIGASAGSSQAAGNYTNVINFTAVANGAGV